jgi:hypothetical protein
MSCFINQDIENCIYILNEIDVFYITEYQSDIEINFNQSTNEVIDIFTNLIWQNINVDTITIQTDYLVNEKLYSTAIRITISDITNELTLFLNEKKKFIIIYRDKNNNCWVDSVIPYDNGYNLRNINFEISNEQNTLTFDLIKTSSVDIKKISNNYFNFNNL